MQFAKRSVRIKSRKIKSGKVGILSVLQFSLRMSTSSTKLDLVSLVAPRGLSDTVEEVPDVTVGVQ